MHLDSWRSCFHSRDGMCPLHLLNPSQTPIYMLPIPITASFPSWLIRFWHACFHYHLLWRSLWVEISTLAYEVNTSCWPERLSAGTLYPYNSEKGNAQKSEISTKLDVYSYRRAHRHSSCSAGVICRGCGVVTFIYFHSVDPYWVKSTLRI